MLRIVQYMQYKERRHTDTLCDQNQICRANHFKNYSEIIFGLVSAEVDILFAAVRPLPKGIGELIFGDSSDDPSQLS